MTKRDQLRRHIVPAIILFCIAVVSMVLGVWRGAL